MTSRRIRRARAAVACVIGDMDLVRPLGLAGIPVAVASRPGARTRYSRFAVASLEWADPWSEPDVLLDRLLDFGSEQPSPPVLFYQGDWDLLLVSRNRERLAQAFRFVIPAAELVEDLVDKARFEVLARRLSLPVPPSTLLSHTSPAAPLPFEPPLVVKPSTRQLATWTGIGGLAKAVEVLTHDELASVRRRLADARVDAIAQRLVPGPESRVESYHVYVDDRGEIAGEFTGRKIRTFPARHGHSTALELTDAPDVLDAGRDCVTRLDFRGVAKFDFKRDDDGRLWLLEVNPRFNLWHHLGAISGVNLPALVYADMIELPRPAVGVRHGARWCQPRHDLAAARAGGMPLRRWLTFVLTCEARSSVALDDPMPIFRGGGTRLRTWATVRESPATAAGA